MDLLPTDEQAEIAGSVRSLITKELPTERLAALDDAWSVVDRDLWRTCAELGWFGLGLPEAAGGIGYSIVEEALLFREIGRGLAPGPYLATVLAGHLAHVDEDAELTARIASGDVVVALAEPHGDPSATAAETVSGRYHVTNPADADLLLVSSSDGCSLVETSELRGTLPVPSIDPNVPLAIADLSGAASVAHLGGAPCAQLHLRAAVLVAAQLAGIAEATVEQSVAYAKDRQQFGQPIGGFQAVKHRCADMAARAEAAWTLTAFAALSAAGSRPDAAFQAHAARVVATNAAVTNAEVNVQNHGGIGFTWEHTAHRYVKRARFLSRTLGTLPHHQAALLAEPPAQ